MCNCCGPDGRDIRVSNSILLDRLGAHEGVVRVVDVVARLGLRPEGLPIHILVVIPIRWRVLLVLVPIH